MATRITFNTKIVGPICLPGCPNEACRCQLPPRSARRASAEIAAKAIR
jgi:hypothetical protein